MTEFDEYCKTVLKRAFEEIRNHLTDRINFLERELEDRQNRLEAAGAVFQRIFKLYRVEQKRNESLLKKLTEIEEKLRP